MPLNHCHPIENPAYPDLVTVASVNFSAVPSAREATVEKMTLQVREACRQGARLVVFPEGVIGAFGPCPACEALSTPCERHQATAETVPGPSTNTLAALASELDTYIVFGIDEADPDDPSVIYNSAVLVGPEGILGTYRKLHLGHPLETCRFTPGDSLPVWDTSIGPIGILICYDFWSNPELSRILALKGARLLVNPTRSAARPGSADYVRNTTVVRAQENLVYAMSANWTGPIGDEGVGAGQSTIAGPAFPQFNRVLAESGLQEKVVVSTLNFRQLGRWYDLFPWRQWRLDPERQLPVTQLVAEEFAALGRAASPEPGALS